MKKILVTGATGHTGSTGIATLLKKITPQQINVISREEEKLADMKAKGINTFIGNYHLYS